MFRRVVKYALAGAVAAGAGVCVVDAYDHRILNSNGVIRFGRTGLAAAQIALDYKWNLGFGAFKSDAEYEKTLSELHLRSAKRLKDVFCKNGGVFIKVGQHIGGLDYLLPLEYVATMKTLHNQAPETDVQELFQTIEQDLHLRASDLFKSIESKPIGTASLAQCHKAVMHNGQVVAVKIQHPQVKKNSHSDIQTMNFLVHCIAFIFPDFKFMWLAEETAKNLPIELDFLNEGKNIEKIANMLRPFNFVKVPKVYWKFCSDRVLTMEYCEGYRVDDAQAMKKSNIDVNRVSRRLGVIFSEMIFTHGFVHCDPHPGNVLINPVKASKQATKSNKGVDFEIVLLDHGLYSNLSKSFRYNYANIWMSILERDIEKLKVQCQSFNLGEYFGLFACIVTGRSWTAVTKGIDVTKFTPDESLEIKTDAAKYLREISIVLNLVPREMLLLLKTNDLLRGIETALHTRNSSSAFIHMSKCCVKLIHSYERELNKAMYEQQAVFQKNFYDSFKLLKFNVFSFISEQILLLKIFSYYLFLYIMNL